MSPLPILTFLCCLLTGQGTDSFQACLLKHPGKIDQRRLADLNGDGLTDLFLVSGKKAFVYFQKKDPAFALPPDRIIELNPEDILFDLEEAGPAEGGGAKLLVCSWQGISCFFLREKEPQPVFMSFSTEALFLKRIAFSSLIWRNLLLDINGDGREDFLLPRFDRFQIFYRLPNGEFRKEAEEIPFPREGRHSGGGPDLLDTLSHSWSLPAYYVGDFSGDGQRDVILYQGEKILLFERGKAKKLVPHPSPMLDFSGKKQRTPYSGLRFLTRDVNGDQIMDILISRMRAGLLEIYLGPFPKKTRSQADHTIHINGWIQDIRLDDVNGDRTPDLLITTSQEIGLFDAIKILASKNLVLETFLFLNHPNGFFSKRPDLAREIDLPLHFQAEAGRAWGVKGRTSRLISYQGDFNGDGWKDLLLRSGESELSITFGRPERILAKRPATYLPLPYSCSGHEVNLEVSDLNEDGFSDIILLYRKLHGSEQEAAGQTTRKEEEACDGLYILLSKTRQEAGKNGE